MRRLCCVPLLLLVIVAPPTCISAFGVSRIIRPIRFFSKLRRRIPNNVGTEIQTKSKSWCPGVLFSNPRQAAASTNNNINKSIHCQNRSTRSKKLVPLLTMLLGSAWLFPNRVLAGGGLSLGGVKALPMERRQLVSLIVIWLGLFIILALLHACEIAITTLYPWKVREIAEEEEKLGRVSVFKTLNDDITSVLTTILVTSTAASIFATTLFTHLVASLFGTRGERYGALALTGLTLFFVELLPKSLGVVNAEKVARFMGPPVIFASTVVGPLGMILSWLSKKTLRLVGVKPNKDGDDVSDSQLRLIVTGALDSGTIDHGEQEMIQGVLKLQDQRVKEIMKPRVEMIAVPKESSVVNVLGVVRTSGYSRIPVYDGEIDNIVGIVLAKSVLDFFVNGVLLDEDEKKPDDDETSEKKSSDRPRVQVGDEQLFVGTLSAAELASRMEMSIVDANLIESCYFVPDTAVGWSVLQEMRKRRVHMAIVVDEFGGTEGLVSLEDIVEEVVGEIYDEDDEDDYETSEDSITMQEDGSFLVRGDADLSDVNTILSLDLSEETSLKEFATLSGFLCMCAGEIPTVGDFIMSRGWMFEILNADTKRILQVRVEKLTGSFEDEDEMVNTSENPFRNLLKLKQAGYTNSDDESSFTEVVDGFAETDATGDSEADAALLESADPAINDIVMENTAEAKAIDRMVESGERKRDLLDAMRNGPKEKDADASKE